MNKILPRGSIDLFQNFSSTAFTLNMKAELLELITQTHTHQEQKRETSLKRPLLYSSLWKTAGVPTEWWWHVSINGALQGQGTGSHSPICFLQQCAVNLQANNYESFQEDKGKTLFPKSNKPDSRTPSWGWKMFPRQLRLSCMLVFFNWHARQAISFHHSERMQFQGSYPPILCNPHKGRRNASWKQVGKCTVDIFTPILFGSNPKQKSEGFRTRHASVRKPIWWGEQFLLSK